MLEEIDSVRRVHGRDFAVEMAGRRPGDAGSVVNSAILNKGNPVADVLFGVDNTFLGRALSEELFVEYESPELENVDDRFELSPFVTPIDYGFVNLNYDIEGLQAQGLEPPETLETILAPEWNGLLVAENPATVITTTSRLAM